MEDGQDCSLTGLALEGPQDIAPSVALPLAGRVQEVTSDDDGNVEESEDQEGAD